MFEISEPSSHNILKFGNYFYNPTFWNTFLLFRTMFKCNVNLRSYRLLNERCKYQWICCFGVWSTSVHLPRGFLVLSFFFLEGNNRIFFSLFFSFFLACNLFIYTFFCWQKQHKINKGIFCFLLDLLCRKNKNKQKKHSNTIQ